MIITKIEDKLVDLLTEATITDADTYPIVGIDKLLLDWNQFAEYPRLVVTCEEMVPDYLAIGQVGKTYFANIFVLNYGDDMDSLMEERDAILDRIESKIRAHQRLDNLVDNISNEKVWNCILGRTRFSKSGIIGEYQILTWIEIIIQTDRVGGPFQE